METISRHELVPFTALMNMIKFNYLDKKEVFYTLLSILGDYDPTDDENKKRVLITVDYLFKKKKISISKMPSTLFENWSKIYEFERQLHSNIIRTYIFK